MTHLSSSCLAPARAAPSLRTRHRVNRASSGDPPTYAIDYDDGDREESVPAQLIVVESNKIIVAAGDGQVRRLTKLLKASARRGTVAQDVNTADRGGRTPLHHAAGKNMVGAIKCLKSFGADSNARTSDGYTPLLCAVYASATDAIRVLHTPSSLRQPNVRGASPLWIAAQNGVTSVLELLVEFLSVGMPKGRPSLDDVNGTNVDGVSPIWIACQNGHTDTVRRLHALGATDRADDEGVTPAWIAAMNGHVGVLKLLSQLRFELDTPDAKLRTPLRAACENVGASTGLFAFDGTSAASSGKGKGNGKGKPNHRTASDGAVDRAGAGGGGGGGGGGAPSSFMATPLHHGPPRHVLAIKFLASHPKVDVNAVDKRGR